MIQRYHARDMSHVLDVWKPLRERGYDVEILIPRDRSHVVCLACEALYIRLKAGGLWKAR